MTQFQSDRWPGSHKLMLDTLRSAVEVRAGGFVIAVAVLGGTMRRRSPETWVDAEMTILLDAANIETGDPTWNEDLRSSAMIDTVNHPDIRFHGKITRCPASAQLELHGTLEFKRRPIPLAMEVRCLGERAGARLIARGLVVPYSRELAWVPHGGRPEFGSPEGVEVVVHLEWVESADPVPVA